MQEYGVQSMCTCMLEKFQQYFPLIQVVDALIGQPQTDLGNELETLFGQCLTESVSA